MTPPDLPVRTLGVGFDLPWGAPTGFVHEAGRDRIAPKVVRYLRQNRFGYLFVSWQPQGRGRLNPADYADAFDDLFAQVPEPPIRALHHTLLNCAALERYDRRAILAFTNALVARYGFRWVNEDLGLWSIHGKPLPYPLPPFLTAEGLDACIRNVREVQAGLDVPFVVEFPGFTDGASFYVGDRDAYAFFRDVVEATDAPCNLDVGHLLSWRWLCGHRGEALYDDLHQLPLDHCFEVHMSGCSIAGGKFVDAHHGVLLDEQMRMLDLLIERCPNLRAVTYEDPRFDDDGVLIPKARRNAEALVARCA